jgi:hypothetical protein
MLCQHWAYSDIRKRCRDVTDSPSGTFSRVKRLTCITKMKRQMFILRPWTRVKFQQLIDGTGIVNDNKKKTTQKTCFVVMLYFIIFALDIAEDMYTCFLTIRKKCAMSMLLHSFKVFYVVMRTLEH